MANTMKYWFNGLPNKGVHINNNSSSSMKYWFNGLPNPHFYETIGVGYKSYSKGEYDTLPLGDDNLTTQYTSTEITNVSVIDTDYALETTTGNVYAVHQYKDYIAPSQVIFSWRGKSSIAPTTSTVYLQIYNRTTSTWVDIDSDSISSADTNFDLGGTITLTDYKDINGVVSCRVYQEAK